MDTLSDPSETRRPKTLRRILAGTDFSVPASNAVVRAAMLAAEHSAGLEIVHITPGPGRKILPGAGRSRRFEEGGLPGVSQRRLEEAGALAQAHGVAAAVRIVEGGPQMLVKEATRLGVDLVVLGCCRDRTLRDAVVGSTADRLMERWMGDTLVVRNVPQSTYGTILACVSLAPTSCTVLRSALAIASQARLQVMHVYQSPFERKLLIHDAEPETLAQQRDQARQEAGREIDALLSRCPLPAGRQLETFLQFGNPSELIPGAAVRYGADLVVVGKNRAVLEEFFLGSVTKQVVRSASADVLVSDSRG